MTAMKRIPTSAEVFAVIWARHHREDLRLCSKMVDKPETGVATEQTEWALAGGAFPLLGVKVSYQMLDGVELGIHRSEHFLCVHNF